MATLILNNLILISCGIKQIYNCGLKTLSQIFAKVSFMCSFTKNVILPPGWSRFAVKFSYCFAFGTASKASCLLIFIAITLILSLE